MVPALISFFEIRPSRGSRSPSSSVRADQIICHNSSCLSTASFAILAVVRRASTTSFLRHKRFMSHSCRSGHCSLRGVTWRKKACRRKRRSQNRSDLKRTSLPGQAIRSFGPSNYAKRLNEVRPLLLWRNVLWQNVLWRNDLLSS